MSPRKTQKLKTFVKLDKKPVAQKGIQYSFENVGVVSDIPGLKGDIVKKYVNGKLKEQKFVTRDKLRKLVQTATRKEQKRFMGGEIDKNKIAKNKTTKKVLVQNNANLQKLLAEQKNQQLLERQVVAQENMVKAAETGNNLDKGFLGLIAIAIGIEVFDR
jgi:hypothetical protein